MDWPQKVHDQAMIPTIRCERFRAVLSGHETVFPASVFDPFSMRAAEAFGFEVALLAGSIASFTVLGAPDLVLLTLSELAEQTRRLCRAGNVPLIVDGDHGYGNALNVRRAVEELEAAGAAAVTVEDSVLPRPFAGTVGESGDMPQLVSIAEASGKLRAALDARSDPGLSVVGRTNMAGVAGREELTARLQAYEAVGVDALMVVGLRTRAEVAAAAAAVRLPLILGSVGSDLVDRAFLASNRVRVCFTGHQPFLAAVQAAYDALGVLRQGVPARELPTLASANLMAQLAREADHTRWLREYL